MESRAFLQRRAEWLWILLLVAIVTLAWCAHYKRWKQTAWATPILYSSDERSKSAFSGDAMWGLAVSKATATGEILPLVPKHPKSLGAPYRANWNDYPSPEEAINAWWGLLAKLFGIFVGANLVLLSAHLAAAASFYAVCRYLRYDPIFSVATAALFALSRFSFWRGLPHLTITFYWHVPLGLLVAWWCTREERITRDRRKLLAAVAIAIAHGVQNPYYAGMFLQFLAGAGLVSALRWKDWRRLLLPAGLGAIVLTTTLLMEVDTFWNRFHEEPNTGAVVRSYEDLERYGLRPLELLLPYSHKVAAIGAWTRQAYFTKTMLLGEVGSPYLGVVGIAALAPLLAAVVRNIVKQGAARVPLHFWGVSWVVIFAMVGGANGALGLLGFPLFRSSNRYSIFILALLLLYLAKRLSLASTRWSAPWKFAGAIALVGIGMFDQMPPRTPKRDAGIRKLLEADRQLVAQVEAQLPNEAMIFQLPVLDFPEAEPIARMSDYEPFRPFLHSRDLRFSYGSVKGRPRDRWQKEVEQLGPGGMIPRLERYGFAAVLIDRRGYRDKAAVLEQGLRDAGADRVLAESKDFICLALTPSPSPMLPPEFGAGWSVLEGDDARNIRWSSGDAVLILRNPEPQERAVRIRFGVGAPASQTLTIASNGQALFARFLEADAPLEPVEIVCTLAPGRNEIRFQTDLPKTSPGIAAGRKPGFRIENFDVADP